MQTMKQRCITLAIFALVGTTSALAAERPNTQQLGIGDVITSHGCHVVSDRVGPPGFTEHKLTWGEAFFGTSFPNSPASGAPIGSFTLKALAPSTDGPAMNARYITVPFVPKSNEKYKITWVEAQPIPAAGYFSARPGKVFVSVSSCKGDLRGQNPVSSSSALRHCRTQQKNSTMSFGTTPNDFCKLTPNQQYYLNIAFVDTVGTAPLSTATTTCDGSDKRCEALFSFQKIN